MTDPSGSSAGSREGEASPEWNHRFEAFPWILELLNHVSLEKLTVELIHHELERPALRLWVRGFMFGDVHSGGIAIDELRVTLTFPPGVPIGLTAEALERATVRVDRALLKVSRDWVNKVLRSARDLSDHGVSLAVQFDAVDAYRVSLAGSYKQAVPFALDFELGIQGNLLALTFDDLRLLKLPVLAVPVLKGFILKGVREALSLLPIVRMQGNDIYLDLLSTLPLPVDLRWRRFQSLNGCLLIEAGDLGLGVTSS
ncbi:MAG: hypothetical protein ACYCW6_30750 [Candidatus Xenobia bacterium]